MKPASPSAGAADWLSLAAAPVFVLMALFTFYVGDGHGGSLCTQAESPSALTGMVPMYLLMAAFHTPPWFRLVR